MTDQPDLQQALVPLAEKAGYAIYHSHAMCAQGHEPTENCGKREVTGTGKLLPGVDGTLTDAEVTVVLGWLAKAGYETCITNSEVVVTKKQLGISSLMLDADTLNAALAAAVKALHEASK